MLLFARRTTDHPDQLLSRIDIVARHVQQEIDWIAGVDVVEHVDEAQRSIGASRAPGSHRKGRMHLKPLGAKSRQRNVN
ncbi:hypothetical protein PMN64_36650 [Bradyrhizobium sp. UFLA01-814]|uniref:hypothetical protein n=1 Tax=Bradyrhizobium sp. UFLA01-814 TaxID=3023480 RepID=UPI00398BB8BD